MIVELNDQYNPAFIYCDAGAGEYQIERLHIIGDENPSTGLKNKVKRMNFKQNIDVIDPVTFEMTKQPMKPFMVTQLQIAFERELMMLSPFDEVLHKQLIDYCVEKKAANGQPIFTSVNEHFVDALGLAYLAMVLEFKELTDMIKEPETSTKVEFSSRNLTAVGLNNLFAEAESNITNSNGTTFKIDTDDRRGDRPSQFRVSMNYRSSSGSFGRAWGSRSNAISRGGISRNSW